MYFFVVIIFLFYITPILLIDTEREEFCEKVKMCIDSRNKPVCGIRSTGTGYRVKIFENECELLKFGCAMEKDEEAYGIVNMDYCKHAHRVSNSNATGTEQLSPAKNNKCSEYNCAVPIDTKVVCGIRKFGPGFKVRLFLNECEMMRYNCEKNFVFEVTDIYVCDGMPLPRAPTNNMVPRKLNLILDNAEDASDLAFFGINDTNEIDKVEKTTSANNVIENLILTTDADLRATPLNINQTIETNEDEEIQTSDSETLSTNFDATQSAGTTEFFEPETMNYDDTLNTDKETKETLSTPDSVTKEKIKSEKRRKNLVIVDATLFDVNGNVNDTIDNFFAATHIFDLPLKEVPMNRLPTSTRRRIVKLFEPIKVFQPFITIPENKSTDVWHEPTLASCYHKCPVECPETYAPVCAVPGQVAREPSVMFKNHCFMDAAQCKMRWDDKSSTSESSAYIESSFMICLGDTLNTLYRFLPLVRTLQHMGRLKKKGKYHYKMRNMGFFNELIARDPKVIG
ncbi:uncharacterized protein LOC113235859 [Hyposmocoma kahamanoa]|uniref:uncharacterized protein LOC113235859 n=1 Tax=Hyposmocoma kahamanoa TaxID=1477025 RepID=UPI000E6D92FB|nr:uncharacterized protein LOC113235859 [Hyposmocoma kahamanoa]